MNSDYNATLYENYKPKNWQLLEFVVKLTEDIAEINNSGLLGSNAVVVTSNEFISGQSQLQNSDKEYLIAIEHQQDSFLEKDTWSRQNKSFPIYFWEANYKISKPLTDVPFNDLRNLEIVVDDIISGLCLAKNQINNTDTQQEPVNITLSTANGGETFYTFINNNFYVEGSLNYVKETFGTDNPTFYTAIFNIFFKIYKQQN
jgi:hypothetical protein